MNKTTWVITVVAVAGILIFGMVKCIHNPPPPPPPCSNDCPDSPMANETMKAGDSTYYIGQLVYSIQSETTVSSSEVKSALDTYLKEYGVDHGILDKADTIISTIEACFCGSNIFLYNFENESLIGKETGLAESSNRPLEGEGGVLSLNLLIHPDKLEVPPAVLSTIVLGNGINLKDRTVPDDTIARPKIAFLDSGVDKSKVFHGTASLLSNPISCDPNVFGGWNFVDNNDNISDDNGHGTTVYLSFLSSLLKSCNSVPDTMPHEVFFVKMLDSCGYSNSFDAACALHYAKKNDADYINCSWGFGVPDNQIERAIYEAVNAGCRVIASAGNSADDLNGNNIFHGPSGYAYSSPVNDPSALPPLLPIDLYNSIFEIEGADIGPDYDFSSITISDVKRWVGSNFRSGQFVEPATGYERLLEEIYDTKIDCTIEGTSAAAPYFLGSIIRNFGSTIISKTLFHPTASPPLRIKKIGCDNCYNYSLLKCGNAVPPLPGSNDFNQ